MANRWRNVWCSLSVPLTTTTVAAVAAVVGVARSLAHKFRVPQPELVSWIEKRCVGGETLDGNIDEFRLIERLVGRLSSMDGEDGVLTGIGDDAAVLSHPAGMDLLVTTDTVIDEIHFAKSTMDYPDVGYKAVAVSISDIAAMGGRPQSVVLALTVPTDFEVAALESIYDGIDEVCRRYQCRVVGGNMARCDGPLTITSTVTGVVPHQTAVLRSGAKPGDVIFVTGDLGASAAGLAFLQGDVAMPGDEAVFLTVRHRRPNPQVFAGEVLREAGATSLNDISDGLASELNEISNASGIRLRVEADRLPIAPAVRNFARRSGKDPLSFAWYGGEDYQLVGTAPSFAFARALARCQSAGVPITQIGRVESGDGVVAETDGRLEVISPGGFNHFRPSHS